MPGLSDAELKKRLEAHNYTVPPITVTTRALLQRKLDQLDHERQKSSTAKPKRPVPTNTRLLDYSSAEEEPSNSRANSADSRRKTSASSRNSNLSKNALPVSQIPSTSSRSLRNRSRSNTPQEQTKVSNTRHATNGSMNNGNSTTAIQHSLPIHRNLSSNGNSDGNKSRQSGLMHFSENEDEESEEDIEEDDSDEDEEDVDDEELEDEEEELEDEEHYEEDEDEENHFTRGVNLAIQTSPGLDDTVDGGNFNVGGTRLRGTGHNSSSRFISSTPAPQVKSTSAYSSSPQIPNSNSGRNGKMSAFPANSPLRRHVAGNTKTFGSLGEVLASLPMSGQRPSSGVSHPSTAWSPTLSSQSSNTQPHSFQPTAALNSHTTSNNSSPMSATDLTTQVGRGSSNSQAQHKAAEVVYNSNRRSTYCTSHNISKLIILLAGIFFLILSYKYATLRPSIDIERLVCQGNVENNDNGINVNLTCVPTALENTVTNITRDFTNILETRGIEILCGDKKDSTESSTMSVSEILQQLLEDNENIYAENSKDYEQKYQNEYDIRSNGFDDGIIMDKNDEDDYDELPVRMKETTKDINMAANNFVEKSFRDNVNLVLTLISENPQWGIKIQCNSVPLSTPGTGDHPVLEDEEEYVLKELDQNQFTFDKTFLTIASPPINWECWFRIWASSIYQMLFYTVINLAYLGIVLFVVYGCYRLYCWRQEKQIREQQDVFELVEQVLSMLVAQHQQFHALAVAANANVSQPSSASFTAKPCLAVNHIRDQLIPPTDRKRKQNIWTRVTKYIRESESRVREDVQAIYGEEHLVWQWIPDIPWSPMTHPGPNPYPYSTPPRLHTTSNNHSGSVLGAPGIVANSPSFHLATSNPSSLPPTMGTPTMQSSYKHPLSQPNSTSTPVSSPGVIASPPWQGAAFNTLSRNVAAPTVAPTSCLKIRHMFDPQNVRTNSPRASEKNGSNTGWIWQVKEEILRRCSASNPPASILHIAVDTENAEGCVYVKAQNTEEAGKVFRILHGQWYRGNLVTVKYLREERYYERFPDAKNQRIPLRASIQIQRL